MMGLEEILADELRKLGAQNVNILNRAVEFVGDIGFMYKANLNLRTAIRILKPIFEFKARNENELYKKIYDYNWEKYFHLKNTFSIQSSGLSETFTHSKYTALKTKDAIVDYFRDKYQDRPNVNVDNPDIQINVHVKEHSFTISLDSSGQSLHKRGYKVSSVEAPMNEVLAAGIILLSNWNQKSNLHDPMCGSGTILIEASMIAHNIPANIFRESFGFQSWKNFDANLWEKIKEISLNKEKDFEGCISGSDNFRRALTACRDNITKSMQEEIKIKKQDFFDSEIDSGTHVIINPPYGERLRINVNDFYKKIGDTLKHKYQGCEIWIISSDIENLKMIGLRPSRKIKLFNGKLECRLIKFDVYEGSKKQAKQKK